MKKKLSNAQNVNEENIINEIFNDTENFNEIENHIFNEDITDEEVRTAISKRTCKSAGPDYLRIFHLWL